MAESWEQGWVKLIFHMYFRLTPEWVFDVSSFPPAARRCKPIRGQVFFCLWNLINNKLREAPHVKPLQCCSISKRPTQAQLLFWIMWSTLAAAWACQQSVTSRWKLLLSNHFSHYFYTQFSTLKAQVVSFLTVSTDDPEVRPDSCSDVFF